MRHSWPVETSAPSRVTSGFGWRQDPFTGRPAFHAAIDIAAAAGTPVVATAQGQIQAVGEHPRLGRYIMVAHPDDSVATYGHLERIAVATGEAVSRGQVLGTVGSTGRTTGPHVDFGLSVGGRPVDPLPLLRAPRLKN